MIALKKSMRATVGDMVSSGPQMRSPLTWFLVLVLICVLGPYAFDVRPRTRRQWQFVALTIAFLAWLLPLMTSLRSR